MGFISEYSLFLAKAATVFVVLLLCMGSLLGLATKQKKNKKTPVSIEPLSEQLDKQQQQLRQATSKKKHKIKKSARQPKQGRLFVLHFHGDPRASQVNALSAMVTAVIQIAKQDDEVLCCIDSPGGIVTGYGLAAAQLARLREANIHLTVAIDQVAASGGYLMACVAHHIIAAPFAMVGSIGVVLQLPNLHRFLDHKKVDIELLTAGKYKRTLTTLGKNTQQGREKMQQDLDTTHQCFQDYVSRFRPQMDINQVATGECWIAQQALAYRLIDQIQVSDDFIQQRHQHKTCYTLSVAQKKSLTQRLCQAASDCLQYFIHHPRQ